MKKIIIILMILTIPVLFSLEVWQVARYKALADDINDMEVEQRGWINKNKKILADISVLRSPERIQRLAAGQLDLEPLDPDKILRIKFH